MLYRPPSTPVVPRERIPSPPVGKTKRHNRPEFKIPENLEPVVRFMFEEMKRQGIHDRVISKAIGNHEDTTRAWRYRHQPRVGDLEAALNVLGFTLVAMPMNREAAE